MIEEEKLTKVLFDAALLSENPSEAIEWRLVARAAIAYLADAAARIEALEAENARLQKLLNIATSIIGVAEAALNPPQGDK